MSNGSFSNPSIEEYVPKIKIIADEMARRKHGIENDIEINEMILRDMIEQLNKKILEKAKTIKKKKASNSINKKNTKTKIPTSNSPEQNPPLTSKSNEPKENENINSRSNQGNMSKEGINAQDGNSNIISTNTNVNTNQNTYSRLNTYYNINTNNNANNNNDLNNNSNIDENNELNQSSQNKSSSNKINNSNNNESSSKINSDDNNMNENNNNNYLNIQENKYKIESINEEETSENKEVKDESEKKNENENKNENEYIEEEIVYSPSLEIDFDDSSDDTNISRSNYMNGKSKKLTLYEREIRNREVRNKILEKKREQNKINEVKGLKPHPKMDKNSKKIINNKDYIPIEERAAKIHSMKLVKQILIEEERKYQKWKEEMDAIYIRKMRTKNFNKEEWDEFVRSQYQWKDEVQYKIRAAQIFRKNVYKKYYFKPNISKKSKSIIKDIQKGNDSFIDEVYVRLFNDYEERKERQKFINENSKPSFKPKISNSSQKLLNKCEKVPNRCNSNSVMNISKINNSKNDYRNGIYNVFNNNKTRNKNNNQIKKIPKSRSQIIINDVNNNNINININDKKSLNNKSFSAIKDKNDNDNDKNYLHTNNSFINQNKNNKVIKKHIENKSQGPTQPTNNTNANNYNNTEINTDLFSSKYVILENPLVRSFIDKNMDKSNSQIKPKPIVPTIPIKEKSTIENNYEGKNDIYGLSQEGQCYFDQSHYDDDEGIKKGKNRENEENEYDDDYFNVDINQNDEESTNKKLPNESLQNSHIFEKVESMNNIDKNRKYGRQTQNDTLNSDDSKLRDSNLYKLNIRESTPLMFKQDVILPSNEYSDFFNK